MIKIDSKIKECLAAKDARLEVFELKVSRLEALEKKVLQQEQLFSSPCGTKKKLILQLGRRQRSHLCLLWYDQRYITIVYRIYLHQASHECIYILLYIDISFDTFY